MKKNELFNALKMVAKATAKTFGPTCEVVIHDLQTREIVAIENGHVTGRKVGDKLSDKAYDFFVNPENANEEKIGYPSRSAKTGKLLKCTTLVIPDDKGDPLAIYGLNIDTEQLKNARDVLDLLLATVPLDSREDTTKNDHVLDHARKIVSDIIQLGKPIAFSSKEEKIAILKKLDEQGIFLVRDVVPPICEALSISQATLYNYLREIRCENQELIIAK